MNRVMHEVSASSDFWSDHRERTRRAIVESFIDMLHHDNPAAISMPKVAAAAGVATRTLYRYFPDKDALMEAASGWFDVDARESIGGTVNHENVTEYLTELWSLLATNIPAVHAQHVGGAGRELRRRRLDRARAGLGRSLAGRVPEDRLADTVDMVVAVMSSSMMLELVDRMGHPPHKAAALATRLVDLLVADAADDLPSNPAEVDGDVDLLDQEDQTE